jgi:hypothetical protein
MEEEMGKVCILKDPSYGLACRICVTVSMEDAISVENYP